MERVNESPTISAAAPLVLASGSPRRRELLERVGLPLVVRPAQVDERLPPHLPLDQALRALAERKARAPWQPLDWSLGADTVVVVDGRVLGKPKDATEAQAMLSSLQGRGHDVLTGCALIGPAGDLRWAEVVATRVVFRGLSAREVAAYVASGEPFGKAGAYAVQGIGAALVARVEGSYTNVVGLPLPEVLVALSEAGALSGPPYATGGPALEDRA